MLKLTILSIGKTKEKWLEEAFEEYIKRLKPSLQVTCLWAKDDPQLIEWAQRENFCVALDPAGQLMTSEEFSHFMVQSWEKGGSRLTLVIGGANGLPPELKQLSSLISLSPLTFTHQMTRLVLIEQIYRALEIHKGSKYHK
jgi:23S rRNA (pseudouridine1915-N3)-methyltransferase